MKIHSLAFLTFIFLLLVASHGFAQPAVDSSQGSNQFAFELYSHLSSGSKNVFFSPYSLSSALSMTYEGARGQTADEMRAVLHLPSDNTATRVETSELIERMNSPDKPYELSAANALWAEKEFPFKEDYLKLVKNVYFAQARNLDFVNAPGSSRLTINQWVSDSTKDHIKDLLPPGSITPAVRLVLTNAVYFKGKWSIPFNKAATRPNPFWITPTTSVQTDMMGLTGKSFKYFDNELLQMVELPYKGDDLSMLIILPRDKDIKLLEKTISETMIKDWEQSLTSQSVYVYIPKFKFDANYQMSGMLKDMGMKLAFDKNDADFSAMAVLKPNEHLYIDQVYHKAWIDVDEQGTEAAAATGVVMEGLVAAMIRPAPPKIFRADHPFICLIQDNKSDQILFMGRVSDPREK